jgi:hypothetical protein
MESIEAQATKLGLHVPVGCSARVIRSMGYEIPTVVAGCEILVQNNFFQIRSDFEPYHTGYCWEWPNGIFVVSLGQCWFYRTERGLDSHTITRDLLKCLQTNGQLYHITASQRQTYTSLNAWAENLLSQNKCGFSCVRSEPVK